MSTTKTLLNISDVFSCIEVNRAGHIMHSQITLETGQVIPLSKNLKRLFFQGDLTCADCGCCGTHLQQYYQDHKEGKTETWRVMTWSKSGNRISFLNLDHIIAQSRGGTWDKENLRVTCECCNCQRGNTPIVEEPEGISVGEVMNYFNTQVKMKNKAGKLQNIKGMLIKRLRQLKLNIKRVAKEIMISVLKSVLPHVGIQPSDELFAGMITT